MHIIKNILKLIVTPILVFLTAFTSAAGNIGRGMPDSYTRQADTTKKTRQKTTYIFFPINEAIIDLEWMENQKAVESLRSLTDTLWHKDILGISASSYASPDGPFRKNLILAEKRAEAMEDLFKKIVPEASHLITQGSRGESWERFRELIILDTTITGTERERILQITDSDLPEDQKERLIKQTVNYRHIRDAVWPMLRYSCIVIDYSLPYLEPLSITDTGTCATASASSSLARRPVAKREFTQRELFYLRTNLLVPLSNFGVEFCIGNNWSVGADYYFPWIFRNPDHKNCFQILGGGIEGRYWFGSSRTEDDRLEGHSVGLNLSGGYYDFERGYTGNQGEFVNLGVDYLYSLPIFKDKMHLEFTVGLGYIYSYVKPYDVFEPGGKAFKREYTKNFNWIGPTKAGVSLVVPIKSKRRECR